MKFAIVLLLVLVSRVAFAAPAEPQSVTIGIQDYAHVSSDVIDHAQRLVTRLYAAVGVRMIWAKTIRPGESIRDAEAARRPLVMNILTRAMSDRMNIPEGTLGLAAGTLDDGGVVAYAMFDPICRAAEMSSANSADVLGLVMAHELGHLLLPFDSHSSTGLMRPHWNLRDFTSRDNRLFAFAREQFKWIRIHDR
jgi:hypothetical protein